MSTQTIEQYRVPTGSWSLDPAHSSARFEIRHAGISTFRGGFDEIEAEIEGGEHPVLRGAVKVASIDIAEEQIKGHVLAADFFDAERYPEVRFTSTSIDIDESGELKLRGDLQIKDSVREVAATGRVVSADLGIEKLGLSLEASIDRKDYGMNWQMELPSGGIALDYEVKLVVELEFAKDGD